MKFITIITVALTAVSLAQAPAPLPAEAQKVLKLFVGKCDATVDGSPELKGTVHGIPVLGGRFVRDEFVLKGGDGAVLLEVSSMITYDTEKKLYRMWSFYSNGEALETEGPWNDTTRTLTTTSHDKAKQQTTTWTSTFSAEGAETWKLITKDQDGNAVREVSGKSTARR